MFHENEYVLQNRILHFSFPSCIFNLRYFQIIFYRTDIKQHV